MRKAVLISIFILLPGLVSASTAGNFTVNNQPTYAMPPDTSRVLILDVTLPAPQAGETLPLESIKLHNAGSALQVDLSVLSIWQDGSSAGWDGDETEIVKVSQSPFWDVDIKVDLNVKQRIFVTVDLLSTAVAGRSLQPQLGVNSVVFDTSAMTGPTDGAITGLERMILGGTNPTTPVSPIAGVPQALSDSSIRWYFSDTSDNEFGFKILDSNLKVVAKKEQANLTYLDETGLEPNTEYAGRRVLAFNDRGESLSSSLAVFPAVFTLAEQKTTSTETATSGEEVVQETAELSTLEKIQAKIIEIQQKIAELIKQLNELLKQQAASIWQALVGFLQPFFGK